MTPTLGPAMTGATRAFRPTTVATTRASRVALGHARAVQGFRDISVAGYVAAPVRMEKLLCYFIFGPIYTFVLNYLTTLLCRR